MTQEQIDQIRSDASEWYQREFGRPMRNGFAATIALACWQAAHARYAQKELSGDFQTTRLIAAHALIKEGRGEEALPMIETAIKCARERAGDERASKAWLKFNAALNDDDPAKIKADDAQLTPVGYAGSGDAVSLDERMKAAGMMPVSEMLENNALGKYSAHAAVNNPAAFESWLKMKHEEFLRLHARIELDKDTKSELYEWAIAHSAVFGSVRANFRQAFSHTAPAVPDSKHPSHETRGSDSSLYDEVCIKCGAPDHVPGGWGKLAEPCPAVRPAPAVPEWVFDGYSVYQRLTPKALQRTSTDNVSDVLDAIKAMLTASKENK